jgi:deazaflavin-dependent oxidoreductase (nitroreductase family)
MTSNRFYKRPTVFRRRVYDPVMQVLIKRFGFDGIFDRRGQDTVQVLAVRGRRTGRWHQRPVGVCLHDGARHLVGFYGESDWALNLRAGSEATLQSGSRILPIRAVELKGAEKADFLRWLVQRYKFFARAWLKVNPARLTDDDVSRLVRHHPVFRVEICEEGYRVDGHPGAGHASGPRR